ncbi:MAG: glycosyltransferase [Ferruginibacter sp.]
MDKSLIKNRDIIMLGIQPWDLDIGHNFKNMAKVICKNNRVLYVNRPLDRITKWKEPSDIKTQNRLKSIKHGIQVLEEVENNLWIFNPQTILSSINWMPHNSIYKHFNKRNNKKLAGEINKAAKKLNFKNSILFIDNDFFNGLYLQDFLDVKATIYYLRDYLLAQPYFYKHGKFAEPELIEKVDLVVTNSLYLNNYAKKYNLNSYYTGQGCGDDYFIKPKDVPKEIENLNGPIIGYCGFLTSMRLDINLIESIAREREDWTIVLVGPEDEDFKKSSLHNLKNVLFTGGKNESELPGFVHNFDVCLNPQIVNQLTIGNYPRKVDEYLAAGKPVVATKTETMEAFAECTYLCEGKDQYISAIENAIKFDDEEKRLMRISVARSHSWENTVEKMYDAINTLKN